MPRLLDNNNNARAAAELDADSSYGDSVSSVRENTATESTFLSRSSSVSFDEPPYPVILPKLQVVPSYEKAPILETADCGSSNSLQPLDPANRDAIRGQGLSVQESGSHPEFNKEPSVISDLGNHEWSKVVETSDEETDGDLPLEAPLQDKLLADHHKFHDGRKGFIPRGHIRKVINEQSVRQHLYECLYLPSSEDRDSMVERYVRQIFSQDTENKSYVIIFTILVLTEKSECIVNFLDERIDDSALPFRKENQNPQGKLPAVDLCPRRGGKRIKAFRRWSLVAKMSFEEWQWAVNAPFFNRGQDGEVKIYDLQDAAVLPFVTRNRLSGYQEIEEYHGGFGKVSKRYIHADHHNLKASDRKNSAFAVKKLDSKNYHQFKAEFDMLAKLGKTNHRHLVSVLGAYCQLNENYLIFDWADCDLLRYWKDRHSEPEFNLKNVLWLAEQCVGLASGLEQIHRYGSLEQQNRTGDSSFKKLYGRHGDIKPENILWYRDSNQGLGTLRICDFGVSEFHSTQSRSGIRNSHVASSPYYRPPEWELQDGTISRSYDIWTIGCLYLEFLGWLLGGWKLFIRDAHASPKCSDFVHDFLDVIQEHLLVVEYHHAGGHKRINSGRLHHILQGMYIKCKKDPQYALKARPRSSK
ncbi:Sporulation protein kinase mde3 [Fusarium oxysporum f. sp. cubense]|uniref:Sporulation protein kinase mde3 n=1 Tax=Fusarium oxysporum f. sp. cubense TaxID=61366 RepID=A0A559L229_FUSOC|nr:Sporulation protein kinase mde3 [Fusarium oxysporum f. sp. cubense]